MDRTPPSPPEEVRTINAHELLNPKGDPLASVTGSQSPAFGNTLLNSVINANWVFARDDQATKDRKAAASLAAVKAFEPRNEVEGMIAAQAVMLHLAAMECGRRAMLRDQPGEAAAKLRRDAANLSRAMVDMAEAIDRRRGKGPQVVRVERVVVHEGGQAIVGNVTTGSTTPKRGEGSEDGRRGKPHAPRALEERQHAGRSLDGATLRSADPERAAVPRAGDG